MGRTDRSNLEVTIMPVIGDWPHPIPETHWILNAERRLWGTMEWEGEFLHGGYYAAIDPADEDATDMLKAAIEHNAWLCQYVSMEEIKQFLKDRMKAFGLPEPDLSRYSDRTLKEIYLEKHPPTTGYLTQPDGKAHTTNDKEQEHMNSLAELKKYLKEARATGLWTHTAKELGITTTTYSIVSKLLIIQETDSGRWAAFAPLGSPSDADAAIDTLRAYCQPPPATPNTGDLRQATLPPGEAPTGELEPPSAGTMKSIIELLKHPGARLTVGRTWLVWNTAWEVYHQAYRTRCSTQVITTSDEELAVTEFERVAGIRTNKIEEESGPQPDR